MKLYGPRTIKTVAICGKEDAEMEKLCNEYNIEVIVMISNDD